MRAASDVRTCSMNFLPNQSNAPASGSDQADVSLLMTKTTTVTSTKGDFAANELPLEKALHRRADAMTDVLTEIMDRPVTPRFWGLNE
jgi:hypothetical protein